MEKMVFRSSISLGLVAILGLVFVTTSVLMVREGAWLGLAINALVVLSIFTLFRTTKYTLAEEGIEIRCGFFKQFIHWNDIRQVKYTSNPISSPAFSFKRIQIDYGKMGSVLISPRSRETFMAEFQRHQARKPAE
jgi:hypothetical protein